MSAIPSQSNSGSEERFSPATGYNALDGQLYSSNASLDAVYGPIEPVQHSHRASSRDGRDIDDVSGIHATATEAVRDVGMDAHTIRAVRHAHGDPSFLCIRFSKPEHASRFVKLVSLGRDGYEGRHAELVPMDEATETSGGGDEASGSFIRRW